MTHTDKPMAADGFTSYRYRGNCDWIMVGARNDQDAISEAERSLSRGVASLARLEVWDGSAYRQAR